MKMTIVSALCAASLLWISTASANLISNGNFEDGGFGAWKTSGDVVLTNQGPFSAAQGMDGYYAGIGLGNGNTPNIIWQDFDVSGYNTVRVSFDWVFDFYDAVSGVNDVFISILRDLDDSPVTNIRLLRLTSTGNANNDGEGTLFDHYSQLIDVSGFTADTRLRFSLTETTGNIYSRAGIDNVNVSPVPEPASMLLFGTGLAVLAAAGRRKFKK